MRMWPAFTGKTRWAVPAGALTAVGAVALGSAITVAQAAPSLPSRTPAQLLAQLAAQRPLPPPLTGTVVETASFGLPQLPGMANTSSITSLLAGSHTVKIWYKDPAHLRLAVPVTMGETDFIRNGTAAWLWQSRTNTATEFVSGFQRPTLHPLPVPSPISLTPEQAAKRILAAVGPTTKVSTDSNVTIAGQAAYELVIAPRDTRSLIDRLTIAVDGQHPNVPLRVQVFARGATSPAFQVGYTSISFVTPAAANFAFRPPAGAKVERVPLGGPGYFSPPFPPGAAGMRCLAMGGPGWIESAPSGDNGRRVVLPGPGWTGQAPAGMQGRRVTCAGLRPGVRGPVQCAVSPPPGSAGSGQTGERVQCSGPPPGTQLPARCSVSSPASPTGSGQTGGRVSCEVIRGSVPIPANMKPWPYFAGPGRGCSVSVPDHVKLAPDKIRQLRPGTPVPVRPGTKHIQIRCTAAAGPHVYGKGWLSVLVLPAAMPPGFMGMGNLAGAAGQVTQSLAGRGVGPDFGAVLGALMQSARPVHGTWGSGKLIRTSLFSALIMNDGRVLVGAVTPQVLYAAAAQAK
jgi:hypothetical protein